MWHTLKVTFSIYLRLQKIVVKRVTVVKDNRVSDGTRTHSAYKHLHSLL